MTRPPYKLWRDACGFVLLLLVGLGPGCQLLKRTSEVSHAPAVSVENQEAGEGEEAQPETVEAAPEAVPPAPQPEPPKPETVPEVDEVSLVEPNQAEPRLLSEDEEEVPLGTLEVRVAEAERLSKLLEARELTPELATQVDSGRAFLQDATEALESGDLKRTAVLIDKCLVLLEDAEQQSRP